MVLDSDIYAAKVAPKKANRQARRFNEQNLFHNENAVAGPSQMPMPPPSNPYTLSQILNGETSTHYFPQLPRGGVPIHPPRWAIERLDGDRPENRDGRTYPAVMHSPRGMRECTAGPPTRPETLPLANLSNQLRQESPRLQNRVRRDFSQLSPHTPTSRDHRGKRSRVVPQSPIAPSQSDDPMDDTPELQIQPQQLFPDVDHISTSQSEDVFRPMDTDDPPPLTPTPSPPTPTPPGTPPATPPTMCAIWDVGRMENSLILKDLLWCTKQGHWVDHGQFSGVYLYCDSCTRRRLEKAAEERAARIAAREAAALQWDLDAQMNQDYPPHTPPIPPDLPPDEPIPPDLAPDEPMPPPNPLSEAAVSAAEKLLMKGVRDQIMEIKLETCGACHERWFDLDVQDGKCLKCRKGKNCTKFQASNAMDPGPIPMLEDLPPLTQMEEMIISAVHALVSLYQIHGGQFKYSGHCCNFARKTAVFHNKVPLLPEECDVIIMRRTGVEPGTDEDIFQDFRVRRHVIQMWLTYLAAHHPTFKSRAVTIDWDRLNNLPDDASVRDQLRAVQLQDMPEQPQDAGPPEAAGNPEEQDPLFTRGFVPNVTSAQTEMEQLHAAAFHNRDAPHNGPEAKKVSEEDAEGLQKEVLLAEGARVMITRNVWTSKGLVNGAQGTVKKIWFTPGSNPQINLPSVVFVECNKDSYSGPDVPEWEGINPSWVPIVPPGTGIQNIFWAQHGNPVIHALVGGENMVERKVGDVQSQRRGVDGFSGSHTADVDVKLGQVRQAAHRWQRFTRHGRLWKNAINKMYGLAGRRQCETDSGLVFRHGLMRQMRTNGAISLEDQKFSRCAASSMWPDDGRNSAPPPEA
ncbi:hypothetical protein B0H10DRAFT_1946006 [Mycena sp. CBHHK59/15]|nr:hypothetical protein B0H10DRAFT_1946006 [Mycena sp. CBHHK59/15]